MSVTFLHNGQFFGPLVKLYPMIQNQGGNYTRFYKLWKNGVETDLTMRKIVHIETGENAGWGFTPGVSQYDEQVILPLSERIFYFVGYGSHYLTTSKNSGIYLGKPAALRTITVSRSGPLPLVQAKAQYQTITPSAELLKLYPDHIMQKHAVRPPELYIRRKYFLTRKFLPRSNAWQYLYDVWYLFDPDVVPDNRKGNVFLGSPYCRLGIDKYTAEALIKVRVKAPSFYVRSTGFIRGFFRPPQREGIERIRRGVRASMAARDTILIDTNVTRVLQIRDLLRANSGFRVGQYVEN